MALASAGWAILLVAIIAGAYLLIPQARTLFTSIYDKIKSWIQANLTVGPIPKYDWAWVSFDLDSVKEANVWEEL